VKANPILAVSEATRISNCGAIYGGNHGLLHLKDFQRNETSRIAMLFQFFRIIHPGVFPVAKVCSRTESPAGTRYNNNPHLIISIRMIESIDHFLQHLIRNRIQLVGPIQNHR
jgi:hypothetical protein